MTTNRPLHTKGITLIQLRDSNGSVAWLCPAEQIDYDRAIVPALTMSPHDLALLRADAIQVSERENLCGATVFRYAIVFDSHEFLLLAHSQELCAETLLVAQAQQVDLATLSQRLKDGATLWDIQNEGHVFPPNLDYLAVLNDGMFSISNQLGKALLNAARHTGGLFDVNVRRLSDGALVHHCKHSLPHAAELLRRGLYDIEQVRRMTGIDTIYIQVLLELLYAQRELIASRDAAAISVALKLGFSVQDIEALIGDTPRHQKPGYRRANVHSTAATGVTTSADYFYPISGTRNEVKHSDKPRVLLLGHRNYEPLIVNAVTELHRRGYEASLLSPYLTAADIRRHYVEPITPDSVKSVADAERPRAILPVFGGVTAVMAALEHSLVVPGIRPPKTMNCRDCVWSVTALSDGETWLAFPPFPHCKDMALPPDWQAVAEKDIAVKTKKLPGLFTLYYRLLDEQLLLLSALPCAGAGALAIEDDYPLAAAAVNCLLRQPLDECGFVFL
ncbi:MAG: hypothetical protein FWE06_00415 [Oscillospiraceae bacterium]|nr:hypothetical protein [Oscillospiraceae bacterium]